MAAWMVWWAALAHGAEWSAAAGTRDAMTEAGVVEGVSVAARGRAGVWSVQVGGYGSLWKTRPEAFEAALADVEASITGGAAIPYERDRWAVSALGGWHFGLPADGAANRGGPVLLVGGELRSRERRATASLLQAAEVAALPDVRPVVGPVFGFGVDARPLDALGLRLAALDRTRFDVPYDFAATDGVGEGNRWFHDPTLTLEIAVTLGGAP